MPRGDEMNRPRRRDDQRHSDRFDCDKSAGLPARGTKMARQDHVPTVEIANFPTISKWLTLAIHHQVIHIDYGPARIGSRQGECR